MLRVRQIAFLNVQEARYQFSGFAEMGVTFGGTSFKGDA